MRNHGPLVHGGGPHRRQHASSESHPKQRGVHRRYQRALRDAQPLQFAVDVDTPDDIRHWIEEWSWNPIGMPRAIREEDQGHLNEDDLDVWLWYQSIVPKTHNSLFERIVWRDIFLTPGDSLHSWATTSVSPHS